MANPQAKRAAAISLVRRAGQQPRLPQIVGSIRCSFVSISLPTFDRDSGRTEPETGHPAIVTAAARNTILRDGARGRFVRGIQISGDGPWFVELERFLRFADRVRRGRRKVRCPLRDHAANADEQGRVPKAVGAPRGVLEAVSKHTPRQCGEHQGMDQHGGQGRQKPVLILLVFDRGRGAVKQFHAPSKFINTRSSRNSSGLPTPRRDPSVRNLNVGAWS